MKVETMLFRVRYETDLAKDRTAFLNSRDFGWTTVSDEEKVSLRSQLSGIPSDSDWYKVSDLLGCLIRLTLKLRRSNGLKCLIL